MPIEHSHIEAQSRPFWRSLFRGLRRRCPNCGEGHAFAGYLRVTPNCAVCGESLGRFKSDDAPPYFTIVIVAKIIVPLILLLEQFSAPPPWVHLSLWLPATVLLCLAILPYMNGATLGVLWNFRVGD